MSAAESIRELTLPVVLISANGLICLALYNRLAVITARLRSFCREQFDMQLRLLEMETSATPSAAKVIDQLQDRLAILAAQRGCILSRAVHLRNALMLLLGAIIGLLLSSLLLGVTLEFALHAAIPLGTFVIGTIFMIAGIFVAIAELAIALDPVEAENSALVPIVARDNEMGEDRKLCQNISAS